MDGSYQVCTFTHNMLFAQLMYPDAIADTHDSFFLFSSSCRYVANRLSEMGETAMSPSSSTDMTDVDMASIAEDELSEKFSVQGIATGKSSGKTKIVRIVCRDLS